AGGETDPLSSILDAASFGVEIVGSDGRPVYANEAHAAAAHHDQNSGSAERTFRRRQFHVPLAGETYHVTLSLDESEQRRFERDLMQRAYFDELTELPNRSLFQESVDALATAGDTPFAVAFIDLDGFKHVNDYYGHAVGDGLLRGFAQRLSATLRPSDMLA